MVDHFLEFITEDGVLVRIRPAKLDDAPSLQRNCLPANTIQEVRVFLERGVERLKTGKKVRLVADVNEAAVGNLEIEFGLHALAPHIATVYTMVNPGFQGKGIATKMLEAAFKIAKERDMEIVTVDVEAKNVTAAKLYAKVWFKEYGRLERGIKRDDQYDDLILLKKDLYS